MNKKKMSSHAWYKIFVYVAMIVFAISIIVPVAWVFLSSVKSQLDLVGDPWSMP
ncbi:MAG: carbohydrate ABC transporter permease, partial [[Clostridium] innocuum]